MFGTAVHSIFPLTVVFAFASILKSSMFIGEETHQWKDRMTASRFAADIWCCKHMSSRHEEFEEYEGEMDCHSAFVRDFF